MTAPAGIAPRRLPHQRSWDIIATTHPKERPRRTSVSLRDGGTWTDELRAVPDACRGLSSARGLRPMGMATPTSASAARSPFGLTSKAGGPVPRCHGVQIRASCLRQTSLSQRIRSHDGGRVPPTSAASEEKKSRLLTVLERGCRIVLGVDPGAGGSHPFLAGGGSPGRPRSGFIAFRVRSGGETAIMMSAIRCRDPSAMTTGRLIPCTPFRRGAVSLAPAARPCRPRPACPQPRRYQP